MRRISPIYTMMPFCLQPSWPRMPSDMRVRRWTCAWKATARRSASPSAMDCPDNYRWWTPTPWPGGRTRRAAAAWPWSTAIASSWGTAHHKRGKLVWFELRRDDAAIEPAADGPPPDVETRTDQRILRTLERLIGSTDCAAVRVCVDRADGQGEQEVASYGTSQANLREFRIAVPLAPPWIGELALLMPGQLIGARASRRRDLRRDCRPGARQRSAAPRRPAAPGHAAVRDHRQ